MCDRYRLLLLQLHNATSCAGARRGSGRATAATAVARCGATCSVSDAPKKNADGNPHRGAVYLREVIFGAYRRNRELVDIVVAQHLQVDAIARAMIAKLVVKLAAMVYVVAVDREHQVPLL